MLAKDTPYRSFEDGEVHNQWSTRHMRHQHRRFLQVFLYLLKCTLAIIVPNDILILSKKFEDWLTSGREVRYEPSNIVQPS